VYNRNSSYKLIKRATRIAQMLFERYFDVELIEEKVPLDTKRGVAGFGSTGLSLEEAYEKFQDEDKIVSIDKIRIQDLGI
jgi:hypothetical protein